MKTKIVLTFIGVSVLTILIVIFVRKIPKTIEVTTFEKSHSFIQANDDELFELALFFNKPTNYLVDKDNVTSVNLKNNEEIFKFNLVKVEYTSETLSLKDSIYYKYNFYLTPTLKLEDDFSFEITNCLLDLTYKQGVNLSIGIGSFSYYYFKDNSADIRLTKLNGLINDFDEKTLVGINLSLSSNEEKEIKINKIQVLDLNVAISSNDIKSNINFTQGEDINSVLGYNYDLFSLTQEEDLNLSFENNINLFIPLKYRDKLYTNKVGLKIEYEINGEIKYFWIDDFTFFETKIYTKYQINNLKYYLYENY